MSGTPTDDEFPEDAGFRSIADIDRERDEMFPASSNGKPKAKVTSITATQFIRDYRPATYYIKPFCMSGSLYSLTGRTGDGKTGLEVVIALAIASGDARLLGRAVRQGRVAYLAFENPDDVRLRLAMAAYSLNIDQSATDNIIIIDRKAPPEDIILHLHERSQREGNFGLIFGDTMSAWYDGKNINDPVETGNFMRRVRGLTKLPGSPSCIVACHPAKYAKTQEELLPIGAGATLNEVDGNLTIWRDPVTPDLTSLHWQGKFRGATFEPIHFRFRIDQSPDLVDDTGDQMSIPVLIPVSEAEVETREEEFTSSNRALLAAIVFAPDQTIRQWAASANMSKSAVDRRLKKLAEEGLVKNEAGQWRITPQGTKASR